MLKKLILLLLLLPFLGCWQEDTAVSTLTIQSFSNVNQVRDVIWHDGLVWAATDGGVAVWQAATGKLRQQWTVANGLSANETVAIVRCPLPRQQIVVATAVGLDVYDEQKVNWSRWTAANSGLQEARITALGCDDASQQLVVGYANGQITFFDAPAKRWTTFVFAVPGKVGITAVALHNSTIWVASEAGVTRLQDGEAQFFGVGSKLDDLETAVAESRVYTIEPIDNAVWFGHATGLTRFENDMVTFFHGNEIRDWPYFLRVDSIAKGEDDTLWTNTAFGGICQFDPAALACRTFFDDEIGMASQFNNRLVTGEGQQLFYGSLGGGISTYDGQTWRQWRQTGQPQSNSYRAIVHDAQGSIWLGGPSGGARLQYDGQTWRWHLLPDELSGIGINTFLPVPEGMWLGHDAGASFLRYETAEWAHMRSDHFPNMGLAGGRITAVAQDGNNHLWFGSVTGLTVWDGRSFTYSDLLTEAERTDGTAAHAIFDLLWDGSCMWVATNRGLFRFAENGILTTFSAADLGVAAPMRVYDVAQDGDSILLAVNEQLLQWQGGIVTELFAGETAVRTIFAANDGTRWLGLADDTVWQLTDDGWQIPTAPPDDVPLRGRHILQDASGNFWFAGHTGGGLLLWRNGD